MVTGKGLLLAALAVVSLSYAVFWFAHVRRKPHPDGVAPSPLHHAIGFITNFFDTLGIGSFATTTSMYRLWNIVRDEKIPGTLNVGHTPPTVVQALIYITIVQVDFTTLVLLIGAAVAGSWFGAGVVSGFSRQKIQIGMGLAIGGIPAVLLAAYIVKSLPLNYVRWLVVVVVVYTATGLLRSAAAEASAFRRAAAAAR